MYFSNYGSKSLCPLELKGVNKKINKKQVTHGLAIA